MKFTCSYGSSIKTFLESVRLVSSMSTVWEDIDGCENQYRCDLSIYLMTVLSSSYSIIMDLAMNAPCHGNNFIYGLNTTGKRYLKGEMEHMGKLVSNDTTNIGILFSASKYVSVKFADQCLHILNNKERFNGL